MLYINLFIFGLFRLMYIGANDLPDVNDNMMKKPVNAKLKVGIEFYDAVRHFELVQLI